MSKTVIQTLYRQQGIVTLPSKLSKHHRSHSKHSPAVAVSNVERRPLSKCLAQILIRLTQQRQCVRKLLYAAHELKQSFNLTQYRKLVLRKAASLMRQRASGYRVGLPSQRSSRSNVERSCTGRSHEVFEGGHEAVQIAVLMDVALLLES